MREIAAVAGVSAMTVSLALRGSPKVSSATAGRVRGVAEALGYVQNPFLRAWMRRRRASLSTPLAAPRLAYLCPWPLERLAAIHQTQHAFLSGARERAQGLGYRVDAYWFGDPALPPERLLQVLAHRGVEGIMVGQEFPVALSEAFDPFAVVAVGNWSVLAARVVNDQIGTMRLALARALEAGCARPGLILWREVDGLVRHAFGDAFRSEARRVGAGWPEPLELEGGDALEGNAEEVRSWYRRERPDVVISHKDSAHAALLAGGWRCPEDFRFAHLNVSVSGVEKVAGCEQGSERIGRAAVELIDSLLSFNQRGLPEDVRTVLVPSRWQPGRTLTG